MKIQLTSDKRIKGGHIGICPLCRENKKLILSHIIPKWAYQWAKAEGNGSFIGSYKSLNVEMTIQDGSKHYLLCSECDQYLGDSENYIKKLITYNSEELQRINVIKKKNVYFNLNPILIRRFALGICFKLHYAKSAPFHDINVEERIIEKLRNGIFNLTFNDLDFPIFIMCFESKIVPGIDPKAMVYAMHEKKESGLQMFSILFAGWEWVIYVDDVMKAEKIFLNHRLRNNGQLKTLIGDIIDQRFVNQGNFLTDTQKRKLKKLNKI